MPVSNQVKSRQRVGCSGSSSSCRKRVAVGARPEVVPQVRSTGQTPALVGREPCAPDSAIEGRDHSLVRWRGLSYKPQMEKEGWIPAFAGTT